MQGDEILDLFYTIVDDEELSSTVAYILMNAMEDQLEDERDWVVLRKRNASITHASSDTYLTAHDLPTRFKRERKIQIQYSNGNVATLNPVAYEDIDTFKNASGYYCVDYANGDIYLLGTYSESVTVIVHYIERAVALADDVDSVWGSYGAVLAYRMAKNYSGAIDGDDVNFRMSENQEKEYRELLAAMHQWDGRLQMQAMGNRAGFA